MKLEITGLVLLFLLHAHKFINTDHESSPSTIGSILVSSRRSCRLISRNQAVIQNKCSLIFLHCLLATQTSDIETNPGPNPKYPCGTCQKEVTWNDKGILCDSCDTWYHCDCQGLGDATYDFLSNSSFSWLCIICGSHNHSTSLADSLDSLGSKSFFTPIENAPELLSPINSPVRRPNGPNASSTPKQSNAKGYKPKPNLKPEERITLLNINCRSVNNKIPELHQIIDQVKPDIICLTETWLKPETHTSEIFPGHLGYQIYRDDRTTGKGGGVLLAVTNNLLSEEQPTLKTNCNVVWSKISITGIKDIYVSSFYKPQENDEHSLTELWSSVVKIPQSSHIWILGDFNLPEMNWSNESPSDSCKFKDMYENFTENLINHNLEQMVKIPTRGKNILDLFLTNIPGQVHETRTLPSLGSSDHDIVFHEVKIKRGRFRQAPRMVKSYKKANWSEFKTDLVNFFEEFKQQQHTDPNHLWDLFKTEVKRLSSKHIPSRKIKSKTDLPWVTQQIIRQIRKRDKLYRKIKRSMSNKSKLTEQFKNIKATIQKQIRNAYWTYLESVIFSDTTSSGHKKKFYNFVKHNKTEHNGIAPLNSEGQTHTDPVSKANILNKQFESVFSKPSPLSLKQLAKSSMSKLSHSPMAPIHITVQGIEKLLAGLNPHKAQGPDEISPRLLKELHREIAPFLTIIFQRSLDTGIVPSDWKHAIITPAFKKGSKSKPCNYRPISLTCIASKLMEHIIVSNMMDYFDTHSILCPQQHGFRSKHSCETQLIGFTQEISDSLDQGQQTDVIVMDFSKAFDKVDHHKLVHKLKLLGVHSHVTTWIKDFLHNRSQQVLVENKVSDRLPVLSGVPQGSVVGPCLFLAYINDLPGSVRSRVRLFADDTIVYLTIKSHSSTQSLQEDLHTLETWEKEWSMEFNPDKCEVLRIHRKKKPVIFPYVLHNTILKSTENAKYLGVTISSNLNWSSHINTITNKAKNTLRFIRRNVKTHNKKLKETAYKTYVRPQVEYCSTVWHPWQKYLTHRIEMIQRSAARYVQNDYNHTSSVTHMLRELKWPSLEQRRRQATLTMLHKIHNKEVYVDHSHLTHTRNNNFLIPHSKTQHHINSFFPRAIRLWNGLPTELKDIPSSQAFCSGVNSFYDF